MQTNRTLSKEIDMSHREETEKIVVMWRLDGVGEIFDGLSFGQDLRNVVYNPKGRSTGWKLLELSLV